MTVRRLFVVLSTLMVTLVLPTGTPPSQASSAAGTEIAGYVPLVPARLLDTRTDGAPVGPAGTIELDVTGVGGVPAIGVEAVVLNVTATEASRPTYITVWPSGQARPLASNLNVVAGSTVPNLVVAKVGADGRISIFNAAGLTHIVVDVQGWFAPGAGYSSLVPSRLLDTRIDDTAVPGGSSIDLRVTGVGGVPATGVHAVVLNVTVTEPTASGFLTVWPSGQPRPTTSNLNMAPGQTVPNLVLAKVGADGKVSIFNFDGRTHVVVDVQGWFGSPSGFVPLTPARVLDTRETAAPVAAQTSIDVQVTGVGGVPTSGVDAVALNVTATEPTIASFLTVWPTGVDRPFASNVNMVAGQTVPNAVIAKVGANGKISIYNNSGQSHVVVDVQGWFGPAGSTLDSSPDTPDSPPDTPSDPPTDIPPTPPVVVEGAEVGWRFVPDQILVEPGEKRMVRLVQTGVDGLPTGSALPAGVTFQMTGGSSAMTATSRSDGFVEIEAGATIETNIVAAHIPSVATATTLAVTIARLKSGVVRIADEKVAFPEPNLPNDGDLGLIVAADTTASGVGPFTWAQIEARVDLPDEDFGGVSPEHAGDVHARYPLVLHGDAPPAGTLIVGSGGSALFGRIVEPAGANTLTVGGYSLVTVEIVGLQDIYQDLNYSLTYQQLVAVGAAPMQVGSSNPATTVLSDGAQPPAPGGPSRRVHSVQSTAPAPPPDPVTATVAEPGNLVSAGTIDKESKCQRSGSVGGFEFAPAVSIDIAPTLNLRVIIEDGSLKVLRLEAGGTVTLNVNARAKMQLNGSIQIDCVIGSFAGMEITAPGPLSAFLSITGEAVQKARFAIAVTGGPKLEAGVSCSLTLSAIAGFSYVAGSGTENLKNLGLTPTCKPVVEAGFNVGDDGALVGVSIEPTIGAPLSVPLGARVGGVVVGEISRFLSWFGSKADLGKVKAISGEVTPQVRLTMENPINTMTNNNAKTAVAAEVLGKVIVEVTPLKWILSRFGATDQNFEVVPYQETFSLASAYAPLNSTRMEAKVAGETATQKPAVYVQDGDTFELVSTLAPPSGVGILSLPLTSAELYKSAATVLTKSSLFSVAVVPSTGAEASYGNTSIKVSGTITPALCEQLREVTEFVLVGDAPAEVGDYDVPAPAFGGRFNIQCVEGKIAWEPTSLPQLDFENPTVVQLKTSGPKPDTVKITGAPLWLSVDPTTYPVAGDDPDTEQINPIELSIVVGGSLSACYEPRTVELIANTEHRGSPALTITEEDPCILEWDPVRVTGPDTVTANLITKGRTADELRLPPIVPDWITVTPGTTALVATAGKEVSIPFTFTIEARSPKCVPQLPRSFEYRVASPTRGNATLTIIDPKVPAAEGCGIRFTPNKLTGSGSSILTIRTDELGDQVGDWVIDDVGSLPEWLVVVPTSGTISTAQPATIGFALHGTSFNPCVGRPAQTAIVSATVTEPPLEDLVPTYRTATIAVTREAIAAVDCERRNGGARGDPHMVSMDGVAYEGQILGEYVYARSPLGATDPFEVVARTEPTYGGTAPVAPTSVTAVAVTRGEHRVETYVRPNGHRVFIDGTETTLVDGVPVQLAGDMSVTLSGAALRIDLAEATVSATSYGSIFDLDVAAPLGIPMVGLLGSPDGDPANDFRSPGGTPYSAADIVENAIPQFFDFVSSWRITDPDDSPFRIGDDQFAAPNPAFDQAVLEEYGDDVMAALGGSDQICVGGPTGKQLYGLALELSIGTPITDLDRYICSYSVSGVATTNGLPTGGLQISLDAAGLQPCVTTSGTDGRYVCRMLPDLTEVLAATGPIMPLNVAVIGRWPTLTATAASGVATFATKAAFNSGPLTAGVDLAVDANSVPRLDVAGTATRDGEILAGERSFVVDAYDAAGNRIQSTTERGVIDIVAGTFAFSRILPAAAVRAVVTTVVDQPVRETFVATFEPLTTGVNAARFDVVYTVPKLTVSGVVDDGINPITGPLQGTIISSNAEATSLPIQYFTIDPDPTTGTYTVTVPLPRAARTATARLLLAPYNDLYPSAEIAVGEAPASVTLDVHHDLAAVVVSGAVVDERGSALPQPSTLTATFRNTANQVVAAQSTQVGGATDGAYSDVRLLAPRAAASAVLRITAGVPGEYFESSPTVLGAGDNHVSFGATLAPVRLALSGTMRNQAGQPLGPVPVTVSFLNAGGAVVSTQTEVVSAGSDGAFTATFVGHRNARSAAVSADVSSVTGVSGEKVTGVSGSLTTGANTMRFDVDVAPVRLSVNGHVTDHSGAALPGSVRLDAYFLGADGGVLSSAANFFTPDQAAGGAYASNFTGHRDATSVLLRAYVGPIGESVTMTVTSLVRGDNAAVFELAYGAPNVTVAGRAVNADGTRLGSGSFRLRVIGLDANGTVLYNQRPTVDLDAEGDYSFTTIMSQNVVAVRATAEVGLVTSDFVQLGDTPVHAGDNVLTLNVTYRPSTVTLTGAMTSSPGVALSSRYTPVQVGVTALNADGEHLRYTQVPVTPGEGGRYSFDVVLPVQTASVRAYAFVGAGFEVVTGGFAPEVHKTVTLNVEHNPPVVVVEGLGKIDGAAVTGNQTVRIDLRGYNGDTQVTQYSTSATPDATGFYRSTFTLPHGATRADVTVRPVNGSGSYTASTGATLAPGENRTLVVDFDDIPTTLEMSGHFKVFAAPATSVYLSGTSIDAAGVRTPFSIGYVDVDQDDGSYAKRVVVPAASVSVEVSASLSSQSGPTWYIGRTFGPLQPRTANTFEPWDTDATLLRIVGTLTDDGERVVLSDDPGDGSQTNLEFGVQTTVPGHGQPINWGYDTTYEYDNTFVLEVILAADATSARVQLYNAPEFTPLLVVPVNGPGVVEQTWDIDLADLHQSTFIVAGTVTDDGVPVVDLPAAITVVGFAYTGMDDPYTEVYRSTFDIRTLADGYYGLGVDLPPEVTLVRATLAFDDDNPHNDGWSRGVEIVPGEQTIFDFDIERGTTSLVYAGEITLEGCTAPRTFYREFWTFTGDERPGDYDWEHGTWPGGTLAARVLVIPDTTAPYEHRVRVHLPTESSWLGSVYSDHNSGGIGVIDITPNSGIGVGGDETHIC